MVTVNDMAFETCLFRMRSFQLRRKQLIAFSVLSLKMIKEKSISLHKVFNYDKTGRNFLLLPDVTLVASFEMTADGGKKMKECITLNACYNVSGTVKLPCQ